LLLCTHLQGSTMTVLAVLDTCLVTAAWTGAASGGWLQHKVEGCHAASLCSCHRSPQLLAATAATTSQGEGPETCRLLVSPAGGTLCMPPMHHAHKMHGGGHTQAMYRSVCRVWAAAAPDYVQEHRNPGCLLLQLCSLGREPAEAGFCQGTVAPFQPVTGCAHSGCVCSLHCLLEPLLSPLLIVLDGHGLRTGET